MGYRFMIQLDDPNSRLSLDCIEAPGSFLWWYLEITNVDGDGIVLIWAYGLPFLPGLAADARAGAPAAGRARPSLNVVTYSRGVPASYILHEYEPDDVAWDGQGHWRFGASEIRSVDAGPERSVDANLEIPIPGGDVLRARIRAAGPRPLAAVGPLPALLSTGSPHGWTPLVIGAVGTAHVAIPGQGFRFVVSGAAYHDRNRSTRPLHELGFRRWLWAHERRGTAERIAYALWPRDSKAPLGFGIEAAPGEPLKVTALEPTFVGRRTLPFGMRSWDSVTFRVPGADHADEPFLDFPLTHCVDQGPFYLRYLRARGGVGSLEVIDPDRVDLARHRPLVEMRVTRAGQRPSIWAPLFQGALDGRPSRLLRYWKSLLATPPGPVLRPDFQRRRSRPVEPR